MRSTLILAVAATLAVGACKSTPEPIEEVVRAPVPAPAPRSAPAPTPAPTPAPVPVQTVEVDPNAPIPGSIADLAYQAGEDRVYFGYDQSTLNTESRTVLAAQAEWLNQYSGVEAVIEGHADERGTREYNLALGARRAEAVKDFLVSQGVAASRLTTVSYGKERPIDGRSNSEGWARNRNGYTNITSGAVG